LAVFAEYLFMLVMAFALNEMLMNNSMHRNTNGFLLIAIRSKITKRNQLFWGEDISKLLILV